MNIITDIKATVKMFTDIRKARKEGAEIDIHIKHMHLGIDVPEYGPEEEPE